MSLGSEMAFRNNVVIKACFLLVVAGVVYADQTLTGPFDISKLGARGDGRTDSTQAFMKAWKYACAASGQQKIVVPKGNYMVGALQMRGPCKSSQIVLELNGNLVATNNLGAYKKDWIEAMYVDNLVIWGSGKIDGQGAGVWGKNSCSKSAKCSTLPNSLVINFCNNTKISGITLQNSKFFHMTIFQSNNVHVSNIRIKAPGDSPNTDGIHIGDSTDVTIADTHIGTGDDCISIGPGCNTITVTGVHCGPGHGISVGSLGRYANEKDVTGVTVKNCVLTGTTNGLRIKSYESSPTPLKACKFLYQDITMKDVLNPIIIDQKYCPNNLCSHSSKSKVKISDIIFRNIKGTSATAAAVNMVCPDNLPCQGVQLINVNLKYTGTDNKTTALCHNVHGTCSGTIEELACL